MRWASAVLLLAACAAPAFPHSWEADVRGNTVTIAPVAPGSLGGNYGHFDYRTDPPTIRLDMNALFDTPHTYRPADQLVAHELGHAVFWFEHRERFADEGMANRFMDEVLARCHHKEIMAVIGLADEPPCDLPGALEVMR